MVSSRTWDWVLLEPATDLVEVGDHLSVDAGGMPIFEVVAVSDGLVCLRDERRSEHQIRSLERFLWRAALA